MSYALKVEPGKSVNLADFDTDYHAGLKRDDAEKKTETLGIELNSLQSMMYAAADTSLLIVLQGRDTSGKDGSIRKLTAYLNAQSCKVASFKVPTAEEAGHDFLWRIHRETPLKGVISIFNRSHYEDVLVCKVHKLVPENVLHGRYEHINRFENLLVDSGTIIVKICLMISKEEQRERLMDREKDPDKSWKLAVADWKERELWDDYTKAYELALEKCSTKYAPWHIVAADHKWYRDLAIMESVVEALRPYRKKWETDLKKRGEVALKDLAEFRKTDGK
jgi:PPK2 family polyphosphate:nucleotide phosphotransferase